MASRPAAQALGESPLSKVLLDHHALKVIAI